MSGQSSAPAAQLFLFEVDQVKRADGSVVLTPKRVVDGREIGVKAAAKILGFKDREAIYRLIDMGRITAWKPDAKRGNAKWRIDWESVMRYKEARKREAACGG